MEVVIHDCPHCGEVLLDDVETCPACGKAVPPRPVVAPSRQASPGSLVMVTCPACRATLPPNVLRCPDCGAYLSPEIEAAARARGMSTGRSVKASREASSDDDVKLLPDYDDVHLVDEDDSSSGDEDDFALEGTMEADETDFEYSPSDSDEYAVADSSGGYSPPPVAEEEQAAEYDTSGGVPDFDQPEPSPEELQPAEEPAAESPAEIEAIEGAPPPDGAESHSVATGGDALLQAALQEQTESEKRRALGGRRKRHKAKELPPGSFIVYCPQGCRIVVQEKHRGRTGRCPKCKSLFFVPPAPLPETTAEPGAAGAPQTTAAPTAKYSGWIQDARLHRVNPAKLKLTPDSLLNDYDTADIGLHAEHLLLVTVYTGGGMFRAMNEPKKKAAVREKVLEHLAMAPSPEGLPAPKHTVLGPEQLSQLKVVQPSIPGEESLFADVPVFGSGRIALRAPAADTPAEKAYVSFTLSQFRTLCETLADPFGLTHVADAARSAGVPMTDELTEHVCHYSETRMHALGDVKYHQADPARPLVLLGWKCEGCGLVVSEDARKKEKIGGKSEGSVPKARCPKCKKPMGNHRLMGLKS